MRKVLSFVLVLALVLGSFSMAFASYSDMAGEDSSEAVEVLSALGVVSGYPDGTFGPDKIVTRGEMAKLIVSALGLGDFATGTSSMYSDMAGHWSNGFVAYATSLGIITGYPDGTFKPDATVTYEEACAMIVRAIGYTAEFLPGGWPAEWIVKANALGILDDVTFGNGQGANRGDIAQMLYNALEVAIGYVTDDGWRLYEGDGPEDEDTMLTRLGAEASSEASIIWGDEDTMINLRSYVGAYANTYTYDGDIIAVIPESMFLTGEYDGDGTFEADNGTDYIVPSDLEHYWVPYFYNGAEDGSCDLGCYVDYTFKIAVDVSGKTINELYSISEWLVSNAFMVDEDILDEFADDATMDGDEFMMDDDDEIDMMSFELFGADSFADLEEDNVVYIYVDNDDYIRRIEVGTEMVEGEITKISSGGDYTIGGKAYERSEASIDWDAEFEGGVEDEVEAYLDFNGDIFKMSITEATSDNYAIVLETGDGSGSGLTGYDPLIKLFLEDGTDETFDVDLGTDFLVDEEWVGEFDPVMGSVFGRIIEYGLDDDGAVDSITTMSAMFAIEDISSKGYYDGYKIDDNAILFTYDDEDVSDEDSYGIASLDAMLGQDDVTSYYIMDEGMIVAMLILDFEPADDVFGVVTDWAETSSDAGYELTFLIDGEEVVYDATEDAFADFNYNYDELYEISLNGAGEVDMLSVVYYFESLSDPDVDGYVLGDDPYYTLDSDVVIYEWNSDDEVYEVATLKDVKDTTGTVYVFDILGDDDGIFDIVFIGGSPS